MKEEGRRMKEEVRSGSLQESARFGTIGHAAVVNRERLRVSALAYGSSIVLRFFFFWHDSARFSTIGHDWRGKDEVWFFRGGGGCVLV
jgi:hypothetical protein